MNEARILRSALAILTAIGLACLALLAGPASVLARENNIAVELVADGAPQPGQPWLLALHFTPKSSEWHGYWSNPGDAGLGMQLDWTLPKDWDAGEPLYPVPQKLVIGGLMNHVYEGGYAVLVPVSVPADASVDRVAPIRLQVDYLACTDRICVPERAQLALDPSAAVEDLRFPLWRSTIAPLLGSTASFEISGNRVRIAMPLPANVALGDSHLFLGEQQLGGGLQPNYSGAQTFIREGDLLVVEVPLRRIADEQEPPRPARLSGILAFDDGFGVRFNAVPGEVPLEGVTPIKDGAAPPPLAFLLLAALIGGLLLNVMPCVFPILSLKALALAKAGEEGPAARHDALAYTAGVMVASAALGAVLLALRAAGEQVGWAFQLQEPGVVVALLFLAVAITANFLGVFEVPSLSISGGMAANQGSFATGLLAAFVATPCTGPFMAAALGAALLLPPLEAMLLFVTLGLGLALPFLAVGFVPALRRKLPRPGPWMETFRNWMALPMGLTALALVWLTLRLGGAGFAATAVAISAALVAVLAVLGKAQRNGRPMRTKFAAALACVAVASVLLLPQVFHAREASQPVESLLSPKPFSEAALAEARATGRPVFVWFTADWCVTCKVNESAAIERDATSEAFKRAGVIALRGDFTRRNAEIAEFLARHGAAGVPYYLWYAPGQDARQLPQVLTPGLLPELAKQSSQPFP